jgi:hypothetical protein
LLFRASAVLSWRRFAPQGPSQPKIENVEWRISAKRWLLKSDLFKMVKTEKLLAHFPSEVRHI